VLYFLFLAFVPCIKMNREDEEDKSSMSSDDESMGSLKEFIVEEENESESSETESSDDETELTEESDEDSDETEDSEDEDEDAKVANLDETKEAKDAKETKEAEGPTGPKTKKIRLSKEKQDEIDELKAEAERFISGSSGTHVGGRTLRSRDAEAIEKRKDTYYEKYAKQEEAKLMEKFLKKDIIDFLKKLEPEWRESFEATGRTWPSPKITMSLESIQELYKPVKEFANLPDSDEEDSDEGEILSDDDISDIESEESI